MITKRGRRGSRMTGMSQRLQSATSLAMPSKVTTSPTFSRSLGKASSLVSASKALAPWLELLLSHRSKAGLPTTQSEVAAIHSLTVHWLDFRLRTSNPGEFNRQHKLLMRWINAQELVSRIGGPGFVLPS